MDIEFELAKSLSIKDSALSFFDVEDTDFLSVLDLTDVSWYSSGTLLFFNDTPLAIVDKKSYQKDAYVAFVLASGSLKFLAVFRLENESAFDPNTCEHPDNALGDFSWEWDDGYGVQKQLMGKVCNLCGKHNRYHPFAKTWYTPESSA